MAKAMPRGVAAARGRAQQIASAPSIPLGEVWAIVQEADMPWYGAGVVQGTFGPNRYWGRIRSRRTHRWRRTCRVPEDAVAYMTVTVARR